MVKSLFFYYSPSLPLWPLLACSDQTWRQTCRTSYDKKKLRAGGEELDSVSPWVFRTQCHPVWREIWNISASITDWSARRSGSLAICSFIFFIKNAGALRGNEKSVRSWVNASSTLALLSGWTTPMRSESFTSFDEITFHCWGLAWRLESPAHAEELFHLPSGAADKWNHCLLHSFLLLFLSFLHFFLSLSPSLFHLFHRAQWLY